MKKILFFLLATILFQGVVFAEDEVVLKPRGTSQPTDPGCPRVPARLLVSAVYDDGVLYFSFVDYAIPASVTVTNESTGETWTMTATHTDETLPVSQASGVYHVEVETNNNVIYEGEYTL